MARRYLFADESGNFDFSRGPSATRYFILVTVTLPHCGIGQGLLDLRRELAWEGQGLETEFHAAEDLQAIRDRVFGFLGAWDFRVDVTLLEKSKAKPTIRATEARFYQLAWYLHMKYVAPRVIERGDEVLVVGASVGTKKQRAGFRGAVLDVARQVLPTARFQVAAWGAATDPCLQIADYCAWAVSANGNAGMSEVIGSSCRKYARSSLPSRWGRCTITDRQRRRLTSRFPGRARGLLSPAALATLGDLNQPVVDSNLLATIYHEIVVQPRAEGRELNTAIEAKLKELGYGG